LLCFLRNCYTIVWGARFYIYSCFSFTFSFMSNWFSSFIILQILLHGRLYSLHPLAWLNRYFSFSDDDSYGDNLKLLKQVLAIYQAEVYVADSNNANIWSVDVNTSILVVTAMLYPGFESCGEAMYGRVSITDWLPVDYPLFGVYRLLSLLK